MLVKPIIFMSDRQHHGVTFILETFAACAVLLTLLADLTCYLEPSSRRPTWRHTTHLVSDITLLQRTVWCLPLKESVGQLVLLV